jgi:hypothetical protein
MGKGQVTEERQRDLFEAHTAGDGYHGGSGLPDQLQPGRQIEHIIEGANGGDRDRSEQD